MATTKDEKLLNPSQWVDAHGDFLYAYAYFRVNSEELAADLVQETFLAGLKAADGFRGQSSERTWLVSILKRKIIDHYRKKASGNKDTGGAAFPFDENGKWKEEHAPGGIPENTNDDMERDEFYRILQFCMTLLPDKWEAVFRMKNLEELKSSEICKELGITSSNFWVLMHRARLQLRECFEKNWL